MKKNIRKWKLHSSKIVFEHKWYRVQQDKVETESGKIYDDYFMGVFPNIVLVVAMTHDNKIPLVRQYKHGAGEILLEVPAGYINPNETPLYAARRELREETGFSASNWRKLGYFYSNPTKEKGNGLHIFLARGARRTVKPQTDEMENIEICLVGISDVMRLIKTNKIKVAGSVAALLLALSDK